MNLASQATTLQRFSQRARRHYRVLIERARHRFRTAKRRVLANYYFLKRPIFEFLPLLGVTVALVILGGFCFNHRYVDASGEKLSGGLLEAIYLTYSLIFMEHVFDFSADPVLQIFYWGMPLLGIVVILDGVVRFGSRILNRDETSREWTNAMAMTVENHVILCGLGKLGLRILQQLLQLGEEVVVLEKDPLCPNLAFARKHGVLVLIGTGREEGIFDELNAPRAKSILLATNDDLANLEMALDARNHNPGIRVVMRMFDQELASKIGTSFDMQQAFSTSAISAPLFATSSSDRSIVNSFYVGEKLLVVANIEIRPESELIGREIRSLRNDHRVFVISHHRGEANSFYPAGDFRLEAGDHVTLQTEPATLQRIHRWNRDPEPY